MSTYLELTNLLLRRLLDVELTESTFASARSTQATAKDCIRAAIEEIYLREPNWPFSYLQGSQLLAIGQEEYAFPTGDTTKNNSVDWRSFRIQKNDGLSVNTTPLQLISHDEWKQWLRDKDEDSLTTGRGVPRYVFLTQGATATDFGAFGVSPSPDAAYTVLYDYHVSYPDFSAFDDEIPIPSRFNHVIINCALKHFYMFKDNNDQAAFWTNEFNSSFSIMRGNLFPKQDSMRSNVVNSGGSPFRSQAGFRPTNSTW